MRSRLDYIEARDMLLKKVKPVDSEKIPLSESMGRILAENQQALEDVPSFNRSPYDGYAFLSEDTQNISRQSPVTLRLLEEVPAGAVPSKTVTKGTAVKILTGAPIPEGADAVCKYEEVEFTNSTVTLFKSYAVNENIVFAGEDVTCGSQLAECGSEIDVGLMGTLAAQGIAAPNVYRRLRIGIISTGNEVMELDTPPTAGKIRNSNRYLLEAALLREGFTPVYLGLGKDSVSNICVLLEKGLAECDAVISTGGVSVGDYDLTPAAMQSAAIDIMFHGVRMKPGMACAYGMKGSTLVCGLSGNPEAALTNFYAIALPVLKKMSGRCEFLPKELLLTLQAEFPKKSPQTRLLRGMLELKDGTVKMLLQKEQGNMVMSSRIGCNVMAVVPAGSGPLEKGTVLKGFMI
ncbi:MAG: molybdopterin molybdotransferase MoeA [Clostridia bacterium]|nr:molybdopterin molybdotransferase MoeA [Clostridia bacterium]